MGLKPTTDALSPTLCYLLWDRYFKGACDQGLTPAAFVEGLKAKGIRVPGIGHRIKSKDNRDKRVELLQQYARKVGRASFRAQGW